MSFDWKKRTIKEYGRKVSALDKIRASQMLAKIEENEKVNSVANTKNMADDSNNYEVGDQLSDYERIRAKNVAEKEKMLTTIQKVVKDVKNQLNLSGGPVHNKNLRRKSKKKHEKYL